MLSSSIPSKCVSVHYPSTRQLKYSNCTVNQSNIAVSNDLFQDLLRRYTSTITIKPSSTHFDQDYMPSLLHVIYCRSEWPGYCIKWMGWLTWTTRWPGNLTWFWSWFVPRLLITSYSYQWNEAKRCCKFSFSL